MEWLINILKMAVVLTQLYNLTWISSSGIGCTWVCQIQFIIVINSVNCSGNYILHEKKNGMTIYLLLGFFYTWLFLTVQLEELLEPYLAGTNLGVPYWDWTKNLNIPNIWKDILTPLKNPHSRAYFGARLATQSKSLTRKIFKTFFQVEYPYTTLISKRNNHTHDLSKKLCFKMLTVYSTQVFSVHIT